MKQRHRRGAFTLVELLVVITIIGMLMAMLFPAMSGVMETVRSTQCRAKLDQIGKAVKNYVANNQAFPCGVTACTQPKDQYKVGASKIGQFGSICQGPNWLTLILTNLGEGTLYKGVTDCMNSMQCGNVCESASQEKYGGVGTKTPKVLLCDSANMMGQVLDGSDGALGYKGLSKGNYAANFGAGTFEDAISKPEPQSIKDKKRRIQGPFTVVKVEKKGISNADPKSATDPNAQGSWKTGHTYGVRKVENETKTMMVSEVIGFDSPVDGRGVWASAIMGGSIFTAKTLPNAEPTRDDMDRTQVCDPNIPDKDPSRLNCVPVRNTAVVWAAARSNHVGGVNVLFCDGHAEFITDSVSMEIWKGMATANGGDKTSE